MPKNTPIAAEKMVASSTELRVMEGLKENGHKVWEYLKEMANKAWQEAAAAVGLGSPATEFIPIGESIIQGLLAGIGAGGDVPGAIASARRALGLNPDDPDTAALLGGYLNEAGRSAVLALREQEFVTAARGLGGTGRRVLFRHIVPTRCHR